MKMLTEHSFLAAKRYIMKLGRPLDRRLFDYHFYGGERRAALKALVQFQNKDGGFGNALEPDIRCQDSSAIATGVGLQIMIDLRTPDTEEIVQRAIGYLHDTYDSDLKVWPIIPSAVDDAPHAPWWDFESSAENFDGFKANPRAALVGCLHHYREIVDPGLLSEVTDDVLEHMKTIPDDQMKMHDLLCFIILAESEGLPEPERNLIWDKLFRAAPQIVVTNPEAWPDYVLRPLDVVPTPDAPLAEVIDPKAVEANLDFELNSQKDDGSWDLAWSWGGLFPEAWAQAERDWKGHHSVKKLITLDKHGRIDKLP